MVVLILLRHAEAEAKHGDGDFARRLTPKGQAHAGATANELARRSLVPDRIIASPAPRALETAGIVARALDAPPAGTDARIYEGSREALLDVLREHARGSKCFLLAGHNPGMSDFATWLSGRNWSMGKGSAASFEIKDWSAISQGCGAPGQPIDSA